MTSKRWLYTDTTRSSVATSVLFVLWFGLVLFMAMNHVVWRDEVRALTKALEGGNVFSMLGALRSEGHPSVWYLLLRGAHFLFARPEVIQVIALIVASAAILLLLLKSPFNLPVIALLLFSHFAIFEYSVMARNYGISMLLLFMLATLYERHRDRGFQLGIVLFLLANCNVHSVLLVGAFLLFWLVDIASDDSVDRTRVLKTFLLNAAIAALGVLFCVLTVYPPIQDAAMVNRPDGITFKLLFKGIFLPGGQFGSLKMIPSSVLNRLPLWGTPHIYMLMSLVLFGSTFGLIRQPSALLASLAALIGLSLFFSLVYPGQYRHDALWLVFLISMYWIAGSKGMQREPALPVCLKPLVRPASTLGTILFLLILVLQIPSSFLEVERAAGYGPPLSRSSDVGALIAKHPELQEAIFIADPDFLVEPLPYYIPNRTYLIRQQRFGNVALFTSNTRLKLSLDDILASAQSLRLETGKPVVILLAVRVNPSLPAQTYKEGYNWELFTTPEQIRSFRASTRLIESFGPAINESFDVYVLD